MCVVRGDSPSLRQEVGGDSQVLGFPTEWTVLAGRGSLGSQMGMKSRFPRQGLFLSPLDHFS